MKWLVLALLAACGKHHGDCAAATAAASKAVWAYNPVDKLVADAWSASITLERAIDDDIYRSTEKQEGNCHEIDRALVHPERADTELLRRSANAFRAEVEELEHDQTEKLDQPLATEPFDTALAAIPVHDDVVPHPPSAADITHLRALSTAWCALADAYHAALVKRVDHLHAEKAKNKADIESYGAQAKANSAHWTAAQNLGRALDDKPAFPLAIPSELAGEPAFATARAAIAVANKECN